jgi:fibronectin-binding autotransporter adhesin
VIIGLSGAYTVSTNATNQFAANLTISNPDATLSIQSGRNLSLSGDIDNAGLIRVNIGVSGNALLTFENSAELRGDGSVELASGGSSSTITTAPGTVLTQQQGHTIRGRGRLAANLVNNGTVSADIESQTMVVDGQPKTNNAMMRAINGGTMRVSSTDIHQSPSAIMMASGAGSLLQLQSLTVTGGSIGATDGGLVSVVNGNSIIDGVRLFGDVEVAERRTLLVDNSLTLDGQLVINPTDVGNSALNFRDSMTVEGSGTIRLAGEANASLIDAASGVAVALGADIRLEGIGQIRTPLTILGTVAPGLGVGTMSALDPFTLADTSTFEAQIGASDNADRLNSTSSFHADGTLNVAFADGFDPPLSWTATIVTATQGVTGTFDTVNAPEPTDPRLEFRVVYLPNEIRVGYYCTSDTNSDTLLNFFDISDFVVNYNSGSPEADIAAPFGSLNFFDIFEFITRYNTGCP